MEEWKVRLQLEELELLGRIKRLDSFIASDKMKELGTDMAQLIQQQLNAMKQYHWCIVMRMTNYRIPIKTQD